MGSVEVTCGKAIGEVVLGRLNNATEAIIISPWVSTETAQILRNLARKANITLITMNDQTNPNHVRALQMLREHVLKSRGRRGKRLAVIGAVMLVLAIILLIIIGAYAYSINTSNYSSLTLVLFGALAVACMVLLLGGIILLIIGGVLYLTGFASVSVVKELIILPKGPLHAKMIILPGLNLVGVGSMNFTGGGLNNLECWAWVEGNGFVERALEFVKWLTTQSVSVIEGGIVEED
ncbi:MAG: hypothetical protein RXQ94_00505 [Caldivirga sp.]